MKFDKELYRTYVDRRASRSPILKNCLLAAAVGGGICALGEALLRFFVFLGLSESTAATTVSVCLIFTSALLTGLGLFDRIARFAGAGTLLPITGFANAVVSPAIDNKAEGLILGVGAKIFTIAGPVILYAVLSGSVYGAVYYILSLFL